MSLRRRSAAPPAQAMSFTNRSSKDQYCAVTTVSSDKWIWAFCLAFRVVNSLLVQTYFNPDEHWQTLEVAHNITFGYPSIRSFIQLFLDSLLWNWHLVLFFLSRYGHLTWEWKKGIRSYLHPLLFALLYKVMGFLHLDTPWLMVLDQISLFLYAPSNVMVWF